jgi:hypothetical protein
LEEDQLIGASYRNPQALALAQEGSEIHRVEQSMAEATVVIDLSQGLSDKIVSEDKELHDLALEECTVIIDQQSSASDDSGDNEYVYNSGGVEDEDGMDVPIAKRRQTILTSLNIAQSSTATRHLVSTAEYKE